MSRSLQKVVGDQLAIWQLLDETQGELNPALESFMAEISQNLEAKVDDYKNIMDSLMCESERLKARAKEIAEASKALENVVERIKGRMKEAMQVLEVDEIKGDLYRFKLCAVKPSLVLDESQLPATFTMQVTETIPDKERIRNALESGAIVAGARLEYGKALRHYINKGTK